MCAARTWDYVRLKALTLGYVLNIYIMGVGCLENSKNMTSTGVLGLETSRKHPKHHSFMFQTPQKHLKKVTLRPLRARKKFSRHSTPMM